MGTQWIDPSALHSLGSKTVALFGAGAGSEELLSYIAETGLPVSVAGVVDNNTSLWGKPFRTLPVQAPADLHTMQFDCIIITSVSGRDTIADQLAGMGFCPRRDFIAVGRFPDTHNENTQILLDALPACFSLAGTHCLNIGPGGFLGLECLLYAFGAAQVSAIDKFSFGMHYPDISTRASDYRRLREFIAKRCAAYPTACGCMADRLASLFISKGDAIFLDDKRIHLYSRQDLCDCSLPADAFDLVCSFGVLEHVGDPDAAVRQIMRLLKPGGLAVHRIITRDHRSFSQFKQFTPFSFRQYDRDTWEAISQRTFYQNRLLPVQWRTLFTTHGAALLHYEVESTAALSAAEIDTFHPQFRRFAPDELGAVNCRIVVRKR